MAKLAAFMKSLNPPMNRSDREDQMIEVAWAELAEQQVAALESIAASLEKIANPVFKVPDLRGQPIRDAATGEVVAVMGETDKPNLQVVPSKLCARCGQGFGGGGHGPGFCIDRREMPECIFPEGCKSKIRSCLDEGDCLGKSKT